MEVSVEGLQVGASVNAGDITLPTDVELAVDAEAPVLHIVPAPTAEQMEAELAAAEAEAGHRAGGSDARPRPSLARR